MTQDIEARIRNEIADDHVRPEFAGALDMVPLAIPDRLAAALFLPPDLSLAIRRLGAAELWSVFLGGASPAATLGLLGDDAAALMVSSLAAWPDVQAALHAAGMPFSWPRVDLPALAAALLDAGQYLAALERRGGAAEQDIRLPSRPRLEAGVAACLDAAAVRLAAADAVDVLDVALVAPGVDLRPLVGLADRDARLRLAAGVATAPAGCALNPYYRRSAVAGILGRVQAAIAALDDCAIGRDEDGWPVWLRGRASWRSAQLFAALAAPSLGDPGAAPGANEEWP